MEYSDGQQLLQAVEAACEQFEQTLPAGVDQYPEQFFEVIVEPSCQDDEFFDEEEYIRSRVVSTPLIAAGPCDIYASGGTPCVAAHSTTRALFQTYSGPLYEVSRTSDGVTANISTISTGGVANAAAQDLFCDRTTCLIATIFDQTGRGNHLTPALGAGSMAAADCAPVTLKLNGGDRQKAYGVFISPSSGYRNDATSGVAVGDAAEGIYAVLDGTHFNGACCFDYGNAETSAKDTGSGHMEALYFGLGTGFGTGNGSGPWLLADLESGLFTEADTGVNPANPTITDRFVTGVVKGQPGNSWAIRGGNAQSGSLSTFYSGVRPSGYNPMSKEGAIILGVGGDNSHGAQGTFYEGAMTSGFPSDEIENMVQANVVAAGYFITSLTSGPTVAVGTSVSFRATTACCTSSFISHVDSAVSIQTISPTDVNGTLLSASWNVVEGLGNSGCVSFEARDTPGSFIRHSGFQLLVNPNDGSALFATDATWCPQAGLNGEGNTIRSWSFPSHNFRHFGGNLFAASDGGPSDFDATALYNNDTTWIVGAAFA
ncbi:glycoside hydrolase family 54 protein [Roridomyces roridus]|uniref:Alpha-L-arabinofuranosidase n=1 Tax=Roridomyces roridus TaxID=1738132 RepID=A0AAD7BZX8_9AGAR|nr:glycoside hydrolase family 54 protein [Roridomyces roridus]